MDKNEWKIKRNQNQIRSANSERKEQSIVTILLPLMWIFILHIVFLCCCLFEYAIFLPSSFAFDFFLVSQCVCCSLPFIILYAILRHISYMYECECVWMYEHQSKTVACSEVDYRESNERTNERQTPEWQAIEREDEQTNKRMKGTYSFWTQKNIKISFWIKRNNNNKISQRASKKKQIRKDREVSSVFLYSFETAKAKFKQRQTNGIVNSG